jgi:hypothetical protein
MSVIFTTFIIMSLSLLELASTSDSDMEKYNALNPIKNFSLCSEQHKQKDLDIEIYKTSNTHLNVLNTSISVISWNILSETWYRGWKTKSWYDDWEKQNPKNIYIPNRIEQIKNWLKKLIPVTVFSLQEVDFDVFEEQLLPFMRTFNYEGIIQHNSSSKNNIQPCGVCMFWNVHTIKYVKHKSFSRTLVIQFENLNIICAHLESKDETNKKRAKQLNSPMSWTIENKLPVIICGDFNSGGDSMLCHVLRTEKWNGCELSNSYEHPGAKNTMASSFATFTCPTRRYRIDHIWYSHNSFNLKGVYDVLTEEEKAISYGVDLQDISMGTPNEILPSDHVPIGACFGIKTQTQKISNVIITEKLCEHCKNNLTQCFVTFHKNKLKIKGKPTCKQIEQMRNHKNNYDDLIETLSIIEKKYIKNLKIDIII